MSDFGRLDLLQDACPSSKIAGFGSRLMSQLQPRLPFLSWSIVLALCSSVASGEERLVHPENLWVADNLEVTVWAHSPQLFNPTNMDVDHEGRIWVTEGVNYRTVLSRAAGDRIVVLEDTDGDGKADSSHVFWQDPSLASPLGIAVFDNRVVISQPPNLLVLTDVDRDLRFDPAVDRQEILLSGFNAKQHDHSLHAVVSGPDGKWYINNGNCGAQITDRSGRTFYLGGDYYEMGGGEWFINTREIAGRRSDDGRIWSGGFTGRINPDGTDLEIVGHGYRNSYENIYDSFGNLFQSDNDDPPACRNSFVLEFGSAGFFSRDGKRHWSVEKRPGQTHASAHWRQLDPGTFDVGDVYGGGGPTGVTFYENGALGDEYRGTYFSADAAKNIVFSYQPRPNGATFDMPRREFLIGNPKGHYRGVHFAKIRERLPEALREGVALDQQETGDFVGDYDPINFRPSDIMVGADGALYVSDWFDETASGHRTYDETASGTIYRIARKGFLPDIPEIDLETQSGQVAALMSPANNVRFAGFEGLRKSGAAALPAIEAVLDYPDKRVAARAIWLLPHLGPAGVARCELLLESADWQTRLVAYRALRRVAPSMLKYARSLASDPSEAVRRDVALSLRDYAAADVAPIFVELSKRYAVDDKNALEAIGIGIDRSHEEIWPVLRSALVDGGPLTWSRRFAKLTWRLGSRAAVPDLVYRIRSPELTDEERIVAVESLAWTNSPDAARAMMDLAVAPSGMQEVAHRWLLRFHGGEWAPFDLGPELKRRGLYDPADLVVTSVTVPEPETKPQYTVEDVLALRGDPVAGRTTVSRCAMCHQVEDRGVNYGPTLAGLGLTQSREALARSIVEPSDSIAHALSGSRIVLNDSSEVHGLVLQSGDPTIIKSTGGVVQTVPADRFKRVAPLGRSLMLSADQLGLSAQQVADIVAYLSSASE